MFYFDFKKLIHFHYLYDFFNFLQIGIFIRHRRNLSMQQILLNPDEYN